MIVANLIHVLPFDQRRGISRREAADIWGVSPNFFDKLVREGFAPVPRAIHGRRIWHRREVEEAFEKWFRGGSAHHTGTSNDICEDNELDRELESFKVKHGHA